MVDNDEYNDEYHFADLDEISPDSLNDEDEAVTEDTPKKQSVKGSNDIRRNALIAVGAIVLAMLGYKFLGSFFSSKNQPAQQIATVSPASVTPPPQSAPVQPQADMPPPQPVVVQPNPDSSQIGQKLSVLEANQQSMRSEISSLNNQLGGINTNVNEVTQKIASLNQMLTELVSKIEQQSDVIARLTERARPKPVRRVVIRGPQQPSYYIKAVIPGRAWLIATNGSTLTVREGTPIPGYGVVRLIDPNQGRVLTSSGQVIKFSLQDS